MRCRRKLRNRISMERTAYSHADSPRNETGYPFREKGKEKEGLRLLRKDRVYEPIKVGDYGDFYYGVEDAVCEDCGARYGEPHKPGCDYERCPRCGHQLVTCSCGEIYEIDSDVPQERIDALIASIKTLPAGQSPRI